LNEKEWARLSTAARTLSDDFQFSSYDVSQLDPKIWAEEGLELAPLVYEGVVENKPLSDEYIANARPIADRRLNLAGLRLA